MMKSYVFEPAIQPTIAVAGEGGRFASAVSSASAAATPHTPARWARIQIASRRSSLQTRRMPWSIAGQPYLTLQEAGACTPPRIAITMVGRARRVSYGSWWGLIATKGNDADADFQILCFPGGFTLPRLMERLALQLKGSRHGCCTA